MADCPLSDNCKFVKEYENSNNKVLLEGFYKRFCNGNYSQCTIKKIAEDLGMDHVPDNMTPDGMPEPGTDDSEWSDEVIKYM